MKTTKKKFVGGSIESWFCGMLLLHLDKLFVVFILIISYILHQQVFVLHKYCILYLRFSMYIKLLKALPFGPIFLCYSFVIR